MVVHPPVAPPPPPGPPRSWVAIATSLLVLVYLAHSWNRDFWPPEPREAAITREAARKMAEGDRWGWLFPTLEPEGFVTDPPLLSWCALAAGAIPGLDPRMAYRIPVALAAGLGLMSVYLAGRRFFDGRVGAAAALIQGSSLLYFRAGSWLEGDMLFSSLSTLAFLSLATAASGAGRGSRWAALGWTALALAALSKSPLLAPLLVLGPLLLWLLFRKGGPGQIRTGFLALRPLAGPAIFILLVAPWHLCMLGRYGWPFLDRFLHPDLGAVWQPPTVLGSWGRPAALLLDFLPWWVFLPLTLFWAKVRFARPSVRLCAFWALGALILLSLFPSTGWRSFLYLWPALSLLSAAALCEKERESIWEEILGEKAALGLTWALRIPLAAAIALALTRLLGLQSALGLGPEAGQLLGETETATRWISLGLFGGAALSLAGVAAARAIRRQNILRALALIAAGSLSFYLAGSFTYRDLNRFFSPRRLSEEVARAAGGEEVALYGRARPALLYYLDRRVAVLDPLDPLRPGSAAEEKLDLFLSAKERVFVLFEAEELEKLREDFPKYRDRLQVVRGPLPYGLGLRAVLASNRAG